jgi:hypothetical protein
MKFFKKFLYFWFLYCLIGGPVSFITLYLLDSYDPTVPILLEKGFAFYGKLFLAVFTVLSLFSSAFELTFYKDEE